MNSSPAAWLWILGQGETEAAEAAPPEFLLWWTVGAVLVALVAFAKRRTWSRNTTISLAVIAVGLGLYGLGTPLQSQLNRWGGAFWEEAGGSLSEPLVWALLFGSIGMILMLPRGDSRQRRQGAVAAIVSLGFFAASVPSIADFAERQVFWILAAVTLVSAVATVTMRNAVYSAIWFALSLLGTAGLFFYQGSQFLGVATVVVYAGAIVVTFLFVVMLAQPEGHATYDRLTWGSRLPKPLSVVASALLVAALAFAISGAAATRAEVATAVDQLNNDVIVGDQVVSVSRTDEQVMVEVRGVEPSDLEAIAAGLSLSLKTTVQVKPIDPVRNVLHASHMARLGGEMFSRRLISVELAGTLLLAALVGAIAMIIQGKRNEMDAVDAMNRTEPAMTEGSATDEVRSPENHDEAATGNEEPS